jgi:hypothetical protein
MLVMGNVHQREEKAMKWLEGKKTYLAALLAAMVAFNRVTGIVPPEVQESLLALAAAMGLAGLRHALGKLEPNVAPTRE